MTPEEIKKIAEEYADMYMERNIPLVSKKDNIRNTLIREAKTVLDILTERFYLVEKDKAKDAYNDFENDGFYVAKYDNKILNDYDVEAYFVSLFGPDIRKEEEE